jgi:hypothetical protein
VDSSGNLLERLALGAVEAVPLTVQSDGKPIGGTLSDLAPFGHDPPSGHLAVMAGDKLVDHPTFSKIAPWRRASGGRDLNPRPPDPQSGPGRFAL